MPKYGKSDSMYNNKIIENENETKKINLDT